MRTQHVSPIFSFPLNDKSNTFKMIKAADQITVEIVYSIFTFLLNLCSLFGVADSVDLLKRRIR